MRPIYNFDDELECKIELFTGRKFTGTSNSLTTSARLRPREKSIKTHGGCCWLLLKRVR